MFFVQNYKKNWELPKYFVFLQQKQIIWIVLEALLSEKTDRIPDEYDWFAPLLGDWDCDYFDEPSEGHKRHVKGEWLFRRILEGAGIQDIFIFPSRATKETEPHLKCGHIYA